MKSFYFSLVSLAVTTASHAALNIALPGNRETALWTNLNNSQHTPVSSNGNPWGPVAADGGSSAGISKTSGPGYFFSGGIYGWHTAPSGYVISDVGPIADLATVVLQARMNQLPVAITLSYNGGSQALAASIAWSINAGSGGFGPITDYGWQWDLSGVADPITSFTIAFTAPSSTVIYSSEALRLDQGDTFAAVPEPSAALLPLGLVLGLARRRKS